MFSIARHIILLVSLLGTITAFYLSVPILQVMPQDFQKDYEETITPKPKLSAAKISTEFAKLDALQAALADPTSINGLHKFSTLVVQLTEEAVQEAAVTPTLEPLDQILANEASGMTLDEFIKDRIQGRLRLVSGANWETFFHNVQNASHGVSVPPGWEKRLGGVTYSSLKPIYFHPSEPPFDTFSELFATYEKEPYSSHTFWLALKNDNLRQYINVYYYNTRERLTYFVPADIRYPYLFLGLILALAGVLFYIFLPWPRRTPDTLAYPLFRHIIMLDFVGIITTGFFFAVPFMVSNSNPLDPDWIPLTFSWFIALIGALFFALATWNEIYRIRILDDRLQVIEINSKDYFYRDMLDYGPFSLEFSGAMRLSLMILVIVMALSRKGGSGIYMNALYKPYGTGVTIRMRDGSSANLWNNEMPDFERVIMALEKNGVPAQKQSSPDQQDQV
jgi:hypothetical protein